jgi:hypothetical protein
VYSPTGVEEGWSGAWGDGECLGHGLGMARFVNLLQHAIYLIIVLHCNNWKQQVANLVVKLFSFPT